MKRFLMVVPLVMLWALPATGKSNQAEQQQAIKQQAALEDANAVEKGQKIRQRDGLYTLTVPAERYYMQQSSDGLDTMLRPMGLIATQFVAGSYAVRLYPKEDFSASAQQDLHQVMYVLQDNYLGDKAKLLHYADDVDFHGKKSYYEELFFPGDMEFESGVPIVRDPSSGILSVVFPHDKYFYWIVYTHPYLSLEPKITDEARSKFRAFLENISL